MNNDQAFPQSAANEGPMGDKNYPGDGLIKLEYAAIQAMSGMMAACDPFEEVDAEVLAEGAVSISKALFAELEKES